MRFSADVSSVERLYEGFAPPNICCAVMLVVDGSLSAAVVRGFAVLAVASSVGCFGLLLLLCFD